MSRVHPINLNYALHKNPDLNLTSFLAVTIIWYYARARLQTIGHDLINQMF